MLASSILKKLSFLLLLTQRSLHRHPAGVDNESNLAYISQATSERPCLVVRAHVAASMISSRRYYTNLLGNWIWLLAGTRRVSNRRPYDFLSQEHCDSSLSNPLPSSTSVYINLYCKYGKGSLVYKPFYFRLNFI